MAINFIPKDPLVITPGLRTQAPRPDRPNGRAGLTFTTSAPEDTYDRNAQLAEFLHWQCREAVLAAVETWEGLLGNLDRWSEDADDPQALAVDVDHNDP
jgi:hypothetical protein